METVTHHEYQASVNEVLRLVIHSLYTNREIFLRELVSNASDAIDKRRFKAITEPSLMPEGFVPGIRIAADPDGKRITVSDDGIGMSADEMAKNLGTIAHSGTAELERSLAAAKQGDLSLIGRFGVGFYSAFLVADEVEVVSRAAGSEVATRFRSKGEGGFTLEPATRDAVGTDVVLHLRDEHAEYASPLRLKELVRRHSDFVAHPIELGEEKLNSSHALWRRTPGDITDEQYDELYRHLTHDWEKPLLHKHFRVEGTNEFSGILYLPKRAPFDLFAPDAKHGLRLHVRRVLVMEQCDELLPRWLRFVRGVVDSEDLPLNVSRETLQDSRLVRTMKKALVKRVLDAIEELSRTDEYGEFIRGFGAVLKEGFHFEPEHKERLTKLVRFASTAGDGLVSLDDYVGRMKPDQDAIYYLVGASKALVESAPHLEALRARGFEVLVLTDPVDPFAIEGLGEYAGKRFVSAMEADAGPAPTEATTGPLEPLRTAVQKVLADEVADVKWSSRLRDSAACLVMPPSGLPPYLERLMRASSDRPAEKRVLELNPEHPIPKALAERLAAGLGDEELASAARLLFDLATVAEGSPLDDPSRLVRATTELLSASLRAKPTNA